MSGAAGVLRSPRLRVDARKSAVKEDPRHTIGRGGERAAEAFLRKEKRFRVIARNWRWKKDELDLVCWDGSVLVFVEVKTRSSDALVPGYYAVDKRKKKALCRACYQYLKRLRPKPKTFRFDIVEVGVSSGVKPAIIHFENIPLFPKGLHWS